MVKEQKFLPFQKAQNVVKSFGFKDVMDWFEYCKDGKIPKNIPHSPWRVYSEWECIENWMGIPKIFGKREIQHKSNFLSYEDARKYVRQLKLKTVNEWRVWKKNRPKNIPCKPEIFYLNKGWKGCGDFLGTFRVSNSNNINGARLPFIEARDFVRKLKLNSFCEWQRYKKENNIYNIPVYPEKAYKKEWVSIDDWLGKKEEECNMLSFEESREFVRNLKLNSMKKWEIYRKENKIKNIPSHPERTYKEKWISPEDWIGTKEKEKILSFEESREFVMKLNFSTLKEYQEYRKKHNIVNIPKVPSDVYRKKGWKNVKHWLGK